MLNKSYSNRFRHYHAYSAIFRHVQTYRDLIRYIQAYSEPCVTLACWELWYIQNSGIFKTRGIFRTLVYPKLCHIQIQRHIQNPGLFRTLGYSEPEAFPEPCETSTIERFEKEPTGIIIFASYIYFCGISFSCPLVYE